MESELDDYKLYGQVDNWNGRTVYDTYPQTVTSASISYPISLDEAIQLKSLGFNEKCGYYYNCYVNTARTKVPYNIKHIPNKLIQNTDLREFEYSITDIITYLKFIYNHVYTKARTKRCG